MSHEKIIVVGDAMLDRFVFCKQLPQRTENNSAIMRINSVRDRPGGAANVAIHIAPYVGKVSLISVFGNDPNGNILKEKLTQLCSNISVRGPIAEDIPTVTKYRIISQDNTQVIRVDHEEPAAVCHVVQEAVINAVKEDLSDCSVLVISDYEKGALSFQCCQNLIRYATNIGCKVLVDGKHPVPSKYTGAFLVKPNRTELATMTDMPVDSIENAISAAHKLRHITKSTWVLVTMDKDGMLLLGEKYTSHLPATSEFAGDAIGAGDIVMAQIASRLVNGVRMEDAWIQAHQSVTEQLLCSINVPCPQIISSNREDKIVSLVQLEMHLHRIRNERKIVFTNGCFDILHAGHIFSLEAAAKCGDVLIVGVNDDESVRRNKGAGRPVTPLRDRLCVLSALDCVDYVISFSDDTPMGLIEKIRPDVLVKGGDYAGKVVVGAEFVKTYGGKVVLTGYDDMYSTTKIIAHIGGIQE